MPFPLLFGTARGSSRNEGALEGRKEDRRKRAHEERRNALEGASTQEEKIAAQ